MTSDFAAAVTLDRLPQHRDQLVALGIGKVGGGTHRRCQVVADR